MVRHENQAKEVVADVVVDRFVELSHYHLLACVQLVSQLLVLALDTLGSTERVDCAMLRCRHEPGARIVGNARLRPPLERGNESVLREVFSQTDIAHNTRQSGDQFRRLDSPDCIDRAVGVGGCHGLQSHQLHPLVQGGAERCGVSVSLPSLYSMNRILAPYALGELSGLLRGSPLRCWSWRDDVAERPTSPPAKYSCNTGASPLVFG